MPIGRTETALGQFTPILTLCADSAFGRTLLRVVGELDMSTTGELACRAGQLLAERPGVTLVLDLSALQFAAVDGVRTLLRIRDAAHEAGGRLVLRDPSDRVLRVLAITGALDGFELESRITDAETGQLALDEA